MLDFIPCKIEPWIICFVPDIDSFLLCPVAVVTDPLSRGHGYSWLLGEECFMGDKFYDWRFCRNQLVALGCWPFLCLTPILFSGLIMVLAGASEFDPQYNKDATSRPADNIQIPQVSHGKRCFNWPLLGKREVMPLDDQLTEFKFFRH